jgi:hypothetical protein
MKNLKRVGLSVLLLCVMAMTALAGETNSPPCAPGETNSPPCAAAQNTSDDSTVQTDSASALVVNEENSLRDLATEIAQQLLLTIF